MRASVNPFAACLLLTAVLLAGCAGRLERLPPPNLPESERILVFADGLHSGVVVAMSPALADLDPQPEGPPAALPYLEVGFAADEWIAASEPGSGTKLRMAFGTSGGVLDLCHRAELARPPRSADIPLRTWIIPLSAEGRRRLDTCIRSWGNREAPQMLRPPARPTTFRFANRRWSIFHNCHDFTVEVLRAAGLELEVLSIYDNDRLAKQMDEAVRQMAEGSITVVGPPP